MVLIKDASTKKLLLQAVDEEIADLKQAYNSGVWTPAEHKLRKARLMSKKKDIRAGKYNL